MDIETIHNSLLNGNRKQMVNQIDEYGLYDFWADYRDFLGLQTEHGIFPQFSYFQDAVISYHRIKNR
jgi:hypothetical protein